MTAKSALYPSENEKYNIYNKHWVHFALKSTTCLASSCFFCQFLYKTTPTATNTATIATTRKTDTITATVAVIVDSLVDANPTGDGKLTYKIKQ